MENNFQWILYFIVILGLSKTPSIHSFMYVIYWKSFKFLLLIVIYDILN